MLLTFALPLLGAHVTDSTELPGRDYSTHMQMDLPGVTQSICKTKLLDECQVDRQSSHHTLRWHSSVKLVPRANTRYSLNTG